MEEKLRASERLSALGLLAAEIAHEIRNPLTVMQMLFHSLVESMPLGRDFAAGRGIDRREDAADESHPGPSAVVRAVIGADQGIDPRAAAFDDVFLLTRHKLQQQGIDVRSSVPENLPPLRADREQVEQVLLNLILNAADAMPEGGVLRLSVSGP